jgi:hypothetical protein
VTLLEGDHVRFNISTDRRDKLERATNIEVLSNTFQFTNEAREMVSDVTGSASKLLDLHLLCRVQCQVQICTTKLKGLVIITMLGKLACYDNEEPQVFESV